VLLKYFTQNVDSLEENLNISPDKIAHAHGTISTAKCLGCDWICPKEKMLDHFWNKIEKDEIPKCPTCDSVIKPNVVFFGEPVPLSFLESVTTEFQKCDCLIVIGTSLKVYPFADLVDQVREHVPRLLINEECVGPFQHGVQQSENVIFSEGLKGTYRDVSYIGDIDEGVSLLLEYIGWKDLL